MIGTNLDKWRMNNRDRALFLIKERDLAAQLIAIEEVLQNNRKIGEKIAAEISALDHRIRCYVDSDNSFPNCLEGHRVDTIHYSVFQDAAHSMSAVGMLAPFLESLFVSIFDELRAQERSNNNASEGDERGTGEKARYWDPHFVFEKSGYRKDLVAGIRQLSKSIGLNNYLPEEYDVMLSALLSYRNVMFHHGLEWPMKERFKFIQRIQDENWPNNWFDTSRSGGEPWIFYITSDFVEHCLNCIEKILEGVGKYLENDKTGPT